MAISNYPNVILIVETECAFSTQIVSVFYAVHFYIVLVIDIGHIIVQDIYFFFTTVLNHVNEQY